MSAPPRDRLREEIARAGALLATLDSDRGNARARLFEKRLRGYRAIGYGRGDAPLGYEEPNDDPVVVWEESEACEFGDPA